MPVERILYMHPDCPYSTALKEKLDEEGTAYDEVNLALKPSAWETVTSLSGGERITPVLVEGDNVTVGLDGMG